MPAPALQVRSRHPGRPGYSDGNNGYEAYLNYKVHLEIKNEIQNQDCNADRMAYYFKIGRISAKPKMSSDGA